MFALKYLFKSVYRILKSSMGRHLLLLMAKYGNVPRYSQRKVSFLKYEFLVPDCWSFLFQFQEIYVEQYYKFETKEKTPVIFDCGANIGTSCLYFSSLYPASKIIAFEADPNIASILKSNLDKNNIKNVDILNKAVWIDNNGIEFSIEGADGASIFGNGKKVKVESVRLRDLLLQTPKIDMLKMDIEGAESAVLKDCSDALTNVENIFIEYHSFPGQQQELNEILNVLSKNNFRYYIDSAQGRQSPLVNHFYRDNKIMDLQLNIFGYKN
ncbi:FkbM family methyltransferase [Sporocytophaga myxococcoides]|uniref:FkbM family methyltransferase n=1 Tax=Sporocytophaga myxococcoides TaxID=153721 RepID=UPI0003FCCF42|nr:FkbM family methyltransferase [Sporocytophaga myxococcoides]